MECYRNGIVYSTESTMLCESFPGIRESARVRTTSESSAPRRCDCQSVHRSIQGVQGVQCPGLCSGDLAPSKTSTKGGSSVDLYDSGMRQRTGSKGIRDFLRLVTRSTTTDDGDKKTPERKIRNGGSTGSQGNDGHVIVQASRLSQLMESMRPRSQSDASSIQRPRRRGQGQIQSHCQQDAAERGEAGLGSGDEGNRPHRSPHKGDITPTTTPGRCHCDAQGRNCRGGCDGGSRIRHESNGLETTLNTLRVSGIPISNGEIRNPIHSPLSPLGRVKSPSHIGPAEFIELYRNRAQSDPRPQVRMEALANVRMKRMQAARLPSSPPAYMGIDSLQEKKLILWKDKKEGNQLLVLPGDGSEDTKVESIKLDHRVHLTYCDLLRATKCYDIIPSSTKMVILDSQLSVKKALYALLNNGIRSAPIWDSETQSLSGMLTVTDFILVLQRYYVSQPHSIETLEEHSISTFKAIKGTTINQLTSIRPEDSLLDAIFALRHHAVHRLPVIDSSTGNIIYMLTYKRLLSFLQLAVAKHVAPFINKTLEELKIGTYENIAMVHLDSTVTDALKLLVDRRVSSLPVVDSNRKLVSMYSRADVINMAAEKTYGKLDLTVGEAQSNGDPMFCPESIVTCQKTDTLMSVVTKLSRREARRLPVIDASGHVTGIVSVSDIVRFIADQTNVDS